MKDEELMRGIADAMRDDLEAEAGAKGLGAELTNEGERSLNARLVHAVMTELSSTTPAPAVRAVSAPRDRTTSRSWILGGATTFAMAAAALLFVMRSAAPAALPQFESNVAGGERAFRSERDAVPLRLHARSNFEWVLRPAQPVSGKLIVRTFYQRDGGQVEDWAVATDISEQGSIRVQGRIEELQLPVDSLKLIAVIAGGDAASTTVGEVRRRLASPDPRWRVVATRIEILR